VRALGIAAVAVLLAATDRAQPGEPPPELFVYAGTYTRTTVGRPTDTSSEGIYAWRFQPATGRTTPIGLVARSPNATFFATHPNGKVLYAVNELPNHEETGTGTVSSFAIDPASGSLTPLNRVSSLGAYPSHLATDDDGRWLFVANYGCPEPRCGGSLAIFPLQADGSVGRDASAFVGLEGSGPNASRQGAPHPHSVNRSPDGRFLLVPDLGADRLRVAPFDSSSGKVSPGRPAAVAFPPGAGPRHAAFSPDGRFVYVNTELTSTVRTFAWDGALGILEERQTVSTAAADSIDENLTAEIALHPEGRWLFVSNRDFEGRGRDSIAIFSVDGDRGTLTLVRSVPTRGKIPRHFAIDPSGGWLLVGNQGSDNVVVFRIDGKTGVLTPTRPPLDVPSPACILFVPRRLPR